MLKKKVLFCVLLASSVMTSGSAFAMTEEYTDSSAGAHLTPASAINRIQSAHGIMPAEFAERQQVFGAPVVKGTTSSAESWNVSDDEALKASTPVASSSEDEDMSLGSLSLGHISNDSGTSTLPATGLYPQSQLRGILPGGEHGLADDAKSVGSASVLTSSSGDDSHETTGSVDAMVDAVIAKLPASKTGLEIDFEKLLEASARTTVDARHKKKLNSSTKKISDLEEKIRLQGDKKSAKETEITKLTEEIQALESDRDRLDNTSTTEAGRKAYETASNTLVTTIKKKQTTAQKLDVENEAIKKELTELENAKKDAVQKKKNREEAKEQDYEDTLNKATQKMRTDFAAMALKAVKKV